VIDTDQSISTARSASRLGNTNEWSKKQNFVI
jgi:hypothetical protein